MSNQKYGDRNVGKGNGERRNRATLIMRKDKISRSKGGEKEKQNESVRKRNNKTRKRRKDDT